MRFVLDDRFGAGGTVYFIWIQWGAGEKGTAVFEMVFLRILSGASAFIVAGGPGDGKDVAAVWKRTALIHDNRMLAERAILLFQRCIRTRSVNWTDVESWRKNRSGTSQNRTYVLYSRK